MKQISKIFLLLVSMMLWGCGRERIRVYKSPKEAPAAAVPMEPSERSMTWTVPKGWTEQPASGMRIGSFLISNAQGKADVSVVRLAGEAGGLRPNINRWREQAGLPPLEESDLGKNMETFEIPGSRVTLVNFLGRSEGGTGPQRILAAIIPRSDETLFVKISGEDKLVQDQKKALIEFIKSLKF